MMAFGAVELLTNVHVALQVRWDPEGLVPGDAESATWDLDVDVVTADDEGFDFKGPAVHGKKGDRFLYLTWGDVSDTNPFKMFRRAKLMLNRVDTDLVAEATSGQRALVGSISLTDEHGCPRCVRVDPPHLTWAVR